VFFTVPAIACVTLHRTVCCTEWQKFKNIFSTWGKCFPTSQSFTSFTSSVYHPDLSRSHRSSFNLWVWCSSNYQFVGLRAIVNIVAKLDSEFFENNLGRQPRKSCFYWSTYCTAVINYSLVCSGVEHRWSRVSPVNLHRETQTIPVEFSIRRCGTRFLDLVDTIFPGP